MNEKFLIKNYYYNKKDTGSTEIQIILLTFKINKIKNHLIKNKKDKNNLLDYIKKLNKRKKLLIYLKSKKKNNFYKIIFDLKIKDFNNNFK